MSSCTVHRLTPAVAMFNMCHVYILFFNIFFTICHFSSPYFPICTCLYLILSYIPYVFSACTIYYLYVDNQGLLPLIQIYS
jgi:hypothetical protein